MTSSFDSLPRGEDLLADIAAQQALRHLLDDALGCFGTLDVTDRHGLFASLNLLERLLAVLPGPVPRLRELAQRLRTEGAATRAAVAAALFRELSELEAGLAAVPASARVTAAAGQPLA
jgi:hypothetical protein